MFFGREEELKELSLRYNSNHFEMGIVYGARRIGKTTLLKESVKNKDYFYFQAKDSNDYDNLKSFSMQVNKLIGIPYNSVYASFSEGFDNLIKYANEKAFVIIIDKIAYLTKADKGFLSELQFYIDDKFKNTKIKLILSSSNISFMKEILKDKRSPLFQRSTFQMHVTKLQFSAALKFLEEISKEDSIKYLSIFGTYPYYLEMIDKNASFDENIKRLLFSKFGNLLDAPDKVLPSASSDQTTYNTILKAIANRKRSNREIAIYLNKPDNYVAAYLPRLVENETIEKREAFNRSQKLNYYEISDNLLRFWYKFIFDKKDEIALGLGDVLFEENKGEIDNFIAHGFEDVAISYLTEKNVKGELSCYFEPIRNYKVENSKLGRSIELDGLAKGIGKSEDHLMVIECKYRKNPFSKEMLEKLKESVSIFDGYKSVDYYLFSKSGFSTEVMNIKDKNIHLIPLDKLFEN